MFDLLADNPVLTLFLVAVLGPALLTVLTHRLGMSPAPSGGLIAGFVNEGYATLFALDTILKVLLVQVIVALGGGTVPP